MAFVRIISLAFCHCVSCAAVSALNCFLDFLVLNLNQFALGAQVFEISHCVFIDGSHVAIGDPQ